jgi:uncharacterized protein YgiB involved in biofilm formation
MAMRRVEQEARLKPWPGRSQRSDPGFVLSPRRREMAVSLWIAAWLLGLGLPIGKALAQSGGVEYGSRTACERAARLSTDQCANAFANAQAEWDEGTPRFPTRAACEARFGRCQIAGVSRGKPSFQPVMDKVVILDRGSNVTVLPVLPRGQAGIVRFSERSIQQHKAQRSDRKQQEAQKRWESSWAAAEQAQGAAGPGVSDGTSFAPEKPEPFDPNWQKQEGVRTYPGPGARQKKPQS